MKLVLGGKMQNHQWFWWFFPIKKDRVIFIHGPFMKY